MDEDNDWRPVQPSPRSNAAPQTKLPDTTTAVAPPMPSNLEFERRYALLNARLRARKQPIVERPEPRAAVTVRLTEPALNRLSVFSAGDIADCQHMLGPVYPGAWPALDGCLGVICTSRSGSSYLARELAVRRRIGRMEEALNPQVVQGLAAADIIRSFANGWFSFKLGVRGMITAELCGATSEYLEKTYFVLLLRRDIISQAVSLVKADQTGQWHSTNTARAEPRYDSLQIAEAARNIAASVASLRRYLKLTMRPCRPLFYEDFEHGDFSKAEAICDEFGVPPITPGTGPKLPPLLRTADAVNAEWIARFQEDMDHRTRIAIERYVAET